MVPLGVLMVWDLDVPTVGTTVPLSSISLTVSIRQRSSAVCHESEKRITGFLSLQASQPPCFSVGNLDWILCTLKDWDANCCLLSKRTTSGIPYMHRSTWNSESLLPMLWMLIWPLQITFNKDCPQWQVMFVFRLKQICSFSRPWPWWELSSLAASSISFLATLCYGLATMTV